MPRLYIAKSKKGGYYTKVENKSQNVTKLVTVNLPKGVELNYPYNVYDCEYFLSCYQPKTGGEPVLVVKVSKILDQDAICINKEINPAGTQSMNAYQEYNETTPELPF